MIAGMSVVLLMIFSVGPAEILVVFIGAMVLSMISFGEAEKPKISVRIDI